LDYYQYAAETWQQIFKTIDFSKIHKIIDLCPGWSPKIEMALLKTSFDGELIIIDKSIENIYFFKKLFEPFNSNFKVKTINKNLSEGCKHKCDLIVANHIIDDLLLDLFFCKNNLNSWNESFFEKPEMMEKIWVKILEDKTIFEEAKMMFRKILLKMVNSGGYVFIAQYLGYQENLYGLKKIYLKCKLLIEDIKKNLIMENYFIEDKQLIEDAFKTMADPYFLKTDVVCLRKTK